MPYRLNLAQQGFDFPGESRTILVLDDKLNRLGSQDNWGARMPRSFVLGVFAFLLGLALHSSSLGADATLQLLPDFNQTHSLSDVVHLGDNTNNLFLPPSPSGTSLTLTFELPCEPSVGSEITLLIDQYNANNGFLDIPSRVLLNGVLLGPFSADPTFVDLTGSTTLPVVTDTFSIDPSILLVGTNTLLIQAGAVVTPHPDLFDDLSVTNIRIVGVVITCSSDLMLTKKSSPAVISPNQIFTYVLTVENKGPDDAIDVILRDDLDPAVRYLGDDCGGGVVGVVEQTWLASFEPLGAGETIVCTLTVHFVEPCFNGAVENTAVVTSDLPDPNATNNFGQADTDIVRDPCLIVSVKGDGFGFVSGFVFLPRLSGILCFSGNAFPDPGCFEPYPETTPVLLFALPFPGSTFDKWEGCDSSLKFACRITMGEDKKVSAFFKKVGKGDPEGEREPGGITEICDLLQRFKQGVFPGLPGQSLGQLLKICGSGL